VLLSSLHLVDVRRGSAPLSRARPGCQEMVIVLIQPLDAFGEHRQTRLVPSVERVPARPASSFSGACKLSFVRFHDIDVFESII